MHVAPAFVVDLSAAVTLLLTACGGPAGTPKGTSGTLYGIQELPSVEGVANVWPRGLNSAGYVVGSYPAAGVSSGSSFRAFLYDPSSRTSQRVGDEPAVAFDVNDQLEVVMTVEGAQTSGARWQAGSEIRIGTLSADSLTQFSYAAAINSRGWLAGWSVSASGMQHAVLWDGVVLHDLTPDETSPTAAIGVNSGGVAVGFLYGRDGLSHAVMFGPQGMADLGTLGRDSRATSINDTGRIVGYSEVASSGNHGFIYDLPAGPMIDISPDRNSMLQFVNSVGDAVGAFIGTARDGDRAMLWRGGTLVDLTDALGDPHWVLLEADAINGSGVIVGRGLHNGLSRGYLLTPR